MHVAFLLDCDAVQPAELTRPAILRHPGRHPHMFRILAIAATLVGLTAAAHADVYRWTDAQGHVQYSDRWVPGSMLVKTHRVRATPERRAARPTAGARRLATRNRAQQQAQQHGSRR